MIELRTDGSCTREGFLLWELGPRLEVWEERQIGKNTRLVAM